MIKKSRYFSKLTETLYQCFELMRPKDKVVILIITFFQSILAFLDLIGIALIGILAQEISAYSFKGIENKVNTNSKFLLMRLISNLSAGQLFSIALALFIVKTVSSIQISRILTMRLAAITNDVARLTYSKFLNLEYEKLKSINIQKSAFELSEGMTYIFIGLVGNILTLSVEMFSLTILLILLLIVDFKSGFFALLFFALIGVMLFKALSKKIKSLGSVYVESNNSNKTTINDSFLLVRELFVFKVKKYFIKEFEKNKEISSRSYAELLWLQQIPKYVMELSLIVGLVFLYLGTTNGLIEIAKLTIIVMTTIRIVPSLLRLQASALTSKEIYGKSLSTLNFLTYINENSHELKTTPNQNSSNENSIYFYNVSFNFSESKRSVFKGITLEIAEGSETYVIGPSGAGKTTFCELILGLLSPTTGEIKISGVNPLVWQSIEGNTISYMPQEPHFFRGSLLENLTLGRSDITENMVWDAIEKAQIKDFVSKLENGLHSEIEDKGRNLSVGQKQRLAIARTLCANPKILILDEITSALDQTTETALNDMLFEYRGRVTVIRITHKLEAIPRGAEVIEVTEDNVSTRKY